MHTDSISIEDRHYSASDGLRLFVRVYTPRTAKPISDVVCLPGLTRNSRDFHGLAVHLARHRDKPRRVYAFDYRGRGQSQHDRDWQNYTVPTETNDLMAGLTALGIDRADMIATSRGGLILFALAASRPGAIRSVVLNDIGPVLEGEGLAHIRAYLQRAPQPASFEEAIAIQKATHANAFTSLNDADWTRWVEATYRVDGNKPVADFDPALLKTLAGIDFNKPLPVYWPQFVGLTAMPMLAIRGENSRLLSADTLAQMGANHPDFESVTVKGQGHPPLLDTAALPARIAAFLDRVDRTKPA